jgi:ClpP class serine protease
VLPLEGVVAKRMNLFSQISGGMSTELARATSTRRLADPNVHSIIQCVDSPGGSVDGTQSYASAIRRARRKADRHARKRRMASAAYWFGSAAERSTSASSPRSWAQIGVVAKHVDTYDAEAKAGIKTTEIAAGKYKRVASSYEPLSAEGRESMQDQVDTVYSVFVERRRQVPRRREDSLEGHGRGPCLHRSAGDRCRARGRCFHARRPRRRS